MAKDVRGISRVNMFEQIKSPSGAVYEPVNNISGRVEYRVKGTEERFYCSDRRMDGETLDMHRRMNQDNDEMHGTGMMY